MLNTDTRNEIRNLRNQGFSATEIGRVLKISYPSVIKYSKQFDAPDVDTSESNDRKTSPLITPFVDQIRSHIKSGISSSRKIERLLRGIGFKGSYPLLNNYINTERRTEFVNSARSYFRVETGPGEQAQVDWGNFGSVTVNGITLNLYVFVYVMSHSRAAYAEFVTNQRQKTLQDCHIHAFRYLGGIPKTIRYDNMKTVVISRKKTQDGESINWNLEFKSFAKYYKFDPELCPIYYPRSKGKVEAGVKFIRNNFFDGERFGKTFFTVKEINEKLINWIDTYANKRKHPVFKETVFDLWQKEKTTLRDITGYPDFSSVIPQTRRVSRISMVSYRRASYWVPKDYIRHKVEVREAVRDGLPMVEFYCKDEKIAEYPLAEPEAWIMSKDIDRIKGNPKASEIEKRVMENPIYTTKVETRDLDYYVRFIK